MKILLVEDSKRLQLAVGTGLRKAGYAVEVTGNGEEGLFLAQHHQYDVIVLDLMLPKMDGLTVLRKLRDAGSDVHVLILTARYSVEDRVAGLRLGADDYLTKPFALEELLARIQALVRRRYQTKNPIITIGDLEIDTASRSVKRDNEDISMTPREYMLLEYLALRRGRLVSRSEIETHIYEDTKNLMSNVIDSAVCNLRKKINLSDRPELIHTRRGMGYILQEGCE